MVQRAVRERKAGGHHYSIVCGGVLCVLNKTHLPSQTPRGGKIIERVPNIYSSSALLCGLIRKFRFEGLFT